MLKRVGKSYVYLTNIKCTVCLICEDMDIPMLLVQHIKNKLILILCKHHTSKSMLTFKYTLKCMHYMKKVSKFRSSETKKKKKRSTALSVC